MEQIFSRNTLARTALVMACIMAKTALAGGPLTMAVPASELERLRLAEIVTGLDHLLNQVESASQTGASGRVQFNYEALRRDLLGRRELIQRYINGSWNAPRDVAPMADTYNR